MDGELISEPITPLPASADAASMSRGEPGLPSAFYWRKTRVDIIGVVKTWKATGLEGGRSDQEVYLRRHYYQLVMSDGTHWTVYCLRQAQRSGSAKRRWYLYTRQDTSRG